MNYPRSQMLAQFIGQEVPTMKRGLSLLACLLMLPIMSADCFAQNRFELTPSISVNETYDDNIDLTKNNRVDDFITVVSPGIALALVREHTNLQLSYTLGIVEYADQDQNDTTRHSANLSFGQDLTQRLRFNLTDTYLVSEDPLEDPQNLQGLRQTRNKYWTNNAGASVNYIFGAENQVNVGYSYYNIENDDATLDDSRVQNPYFNLNYWFDVKNGTELRFRYTDAKFSRDDSSLGLAAPDYKAYAPGIRYIRRFSPNSNAYVTYNYSAYEYASDFTGVIARDLTQDFVVHDGNVGIEHSFSPEYTVAASAGYFIKVNDITDNQDGPTFTAALTRKFARGSITGGGNGGWSYENLQQGVGLTSGLSQYYGAYLKGTYQVLEPVNVYAGASYRHDKYTLDKTDFFTGNAGLRWTFLRWFALSLDYTYAQRTADRSIGQEYTDNRVALILSAGRLFIW
jgi:hypothetical protein